MIILFAMINSLAARENARRAAPAPPDRATWGVYAGDGKTREREGQRRRSELFRRHRVRAKLPRRPSADRRGVVAHIELMQSGLQLRIVGGLAVSGYRVGVPFGNAAAKLGYTPGIPAPFC